MINIDTIKALVNDAEALRKEYERFLYSKEEDDKEEEKDYAHDAYNRKVDELVKTIDQIAEQEAAEIQRRIGCSVQTEIALEEAIYNKLYDEFVCGNLFDR